MERTQYENKIVYLNEVENDFDKNTPAYVYSRNEIKYYNSLSKKEQMQSYIHMNDIIIPMLLKVDKRGVLYFAMQYTYIPACNKIFLELPAYKMFRISKKDNSNEINKENLYSKDDIEYTINSILENIKYKKIYWKELSSDFQPVSQSITDQMAKFIEIEVEYKENKEILQWYPINCLENLLDRQDLNMSIQTKYGLMLFKEKYKDELKKLIPTNFEENKMLLNKTFNLKQRHQKKIYEIYRFGMIEKHKIDKKILKLHYKNKIECFGDKAVYATSKNSVQCIITKIENGEIKVGLSKQQRSPFIARTEVDEYFYENPAGLVEEGEKFDAAAKREALEETGIQINGNMNKLSGKLLFSYGTEEMSEIYLTELEENYVQTKQKLDEQENISEIEWYNLKTLDIDKLHSPIATKLSLIMSRTFYSL